MLYVILTLVVLTALFIYLLGISDTIGALASGERLHRMESTKTFKDGVFQNIEITPAVKEGVSQFTMLRKFFFDKDKRNIPSTPLPVIQTDLKNIPLDQDVYVWFGHSSYFLQIDGKRILVDPVFSKHASPVPFGVKAFDMTYTYQVDDMPEVDVLLITHDHFDHLDYPTFMSFKNKAKQIITSVGVGAHLEKWGYPAERIHELYWGESETIDSLTFTANVARHFSGRWFKRNTSLWSSFVLKTPDYNIFIGGDSGYGKHFKEIGDKYGPFDFSIIENGQYNDMWHYIHLMPEEAISAAKELKTKNLIPVHNSKFPLANHAWDEPMIRISAEAEKQGQALLTPQMGQIIFLNQNNITKHWWEGIN
ncbi:MBL fold metallo-hydrolase [Sphingobacterium sp. DK4209]|uniref:MBL fold metallo-hydrolase n=2 Tax=Sphingobacterium zhuxiongii TaxID=2662364 RepID=A0A5Q0QED9_9SPHI|nr:MBL fold metallo-hydrolase [Sphingobacterium sp. DK4209]QGA28185.1 MBL fold metallo-hydrolase [Sphingobacterium sp. dk4302]